LGTMRELLAPDDTRDALRNLGGLLLGIGALMLFLRKDNEWGTFADFLIYAIPAVLLYGGAIYSRFEIDRLRPWQAVFSVFGLLFVPLALGELVNLIGDEGDSGNDLNIFWIFGVTAALGVFAALRAGVRFQLLAASIAGLVAWIALWSKILDGLGDDLGVTRVLFGIYAIIVLIAAIVLWRADRGGAEGGPALRESDVGLLRFSELFTGAGIAAVISAGLGITAAATLSPLPIDVPTFEASVIWDTLLLLISLGLVVVGSWIGVRGPVYIGTIGLTLFLFIAGFDFDSDSPDRTRAVGWPLILLVVGGLALAASLVRGVTLGDGPRRAVEDFRKGR
jgi:hypothetical protein